MSAATARHERAQSQPFGGSASPRREQISTEAVLTAPRRPDALLSNENFPSREVSLPKQPAPPTHSPRSPTSRPSTSSPVLNKLLESRPLGLLIADRLPNSFFTPSALERWGNSAIYKALGVHLFKDLVPTGGKSLAKQMGKPLLSGSTTEERLTCLRAFERWTRGAETSHWIGFALQSALAATLLESGKPLLALLPLITTTVIDLYPIMLQRFNRIRLNDTIDAHTSKLDRASHFSRQAQRAP
jgi:hypothetical protein